MLLSLPGTNAILCPVLGVCCPQTTTATQTKTVLQTQTSISTVTTTTTAAATTPTPYAVLDVYTLNDICRSNFAGDSSGFAVLRQGECKNIEQAYSSPEDIKSERVTRVFEQPDCQSCTVPVFNESGCAGEQKVVQLTRGESTDCKGTTMPWVSPADSGDGGPTIKSFRLNCASTCGA
jgi:hypothetical protein